MNSTIYDITAGMMNEVQRQELIAANLAGVNLAGFKGRQLLEPAFANELDAAEQALEPTEATNFEQGELRHTHRTLDMALVGDGFFEVTTADGQALLTRNGNFVVNADGALVTQEGHTVNGAGGALQFAPTDSIQSVVLSEDGTIGIHGDDGQRKEIGRLNVVKTDQPADLERLSANYYIRPETVAQAEAGQVRVVNGYLEGANIEPVREMAAMIESVREFEMGQKMLEMHAALARQEQQKLQA